MSKDAKGGEVRYWPIGKPIPEGWVVAASFDNSHHGHYSILIQRIESVSDHEAAVRRNFAHLVTNIAAVFGNEAAVDMLQDELAKLGRRPS